MLLTDALEAFFVSRSAEGKAQKTISFYRDNISTYLAYLEEARLLGDAWADPKTIELFLLSERSRNLSDFTVHARYRALRVFCNWLVSRGLLQEFSDRKSARAKAGCNCAAPHKQRRIRDASEQHPGRGRCLAGQPRSPPATAALLDWPARRRGGPVFRPAKSTWPAGLYSFGKPRVAGPATCRCLAT